MYFQGITKLSEFTIIFTHIFKVSDTFSHNTVSVKIIFEQKYYNFQAFCCSSAGRVQIPIQKQENMQANVTNMKGAFSHPTGLLAGLPGQNWLNAHE